MKIIKPGHKEFVATCLRCGCVFSYTIDELKKRWPMKFMKCPECEEEVYHKEFSEKVPDLDIRTGGDYTTTSDNCPVCGSPMLQDHSVVYTSNPPQYKMICPKCGFTKYSNIFKPTGYTGTASPFTHKYEPSSTGTPITEMFLDDSITISGSNVDATGAVGFSNVFSGDITCLNSVATGSE